MVVNERPLKRAKGNCVTADLYDFLTFPSETHAPTTFLPFRDAVKTFLMRHARVTHTHTPSILPSLLTWQILFHVGDLEEEDGGGVVLALDVVEEDVTRSTRSVYCNQCRVVGWSGHPVCRKRYHFIIRANPADGYQKSCYHCGNSLHLMDSRCKLCQSVITTDDVEEWVYSQFEDDNHLLHGVVHSNGFGHLLRLNGREGGSNFLSGHHIMNFWDRLCKLLSVRKVSVMDASRKYGTEYRLLHTICYGHSWYGDWGYELGRGSYALTLDAYMKAVENLASVPLAPFLFHRGSQRTQLQDVIAFYQSLSDSELGTLKNLFTFLLKLIHGSTRTLLPKATGKCIDADASNVLCAWTRNDVEFVQQSMVKLLAAASGGDSWVRRHSLKGVMCKAASPEVLDYCLKYLGGKFAAGGMVVQTRYNPDFHDTEFRLVPHSFTHYGNGLTTNHLSKLHLKADVKFLFDSLVNPKTMMPFRPQATRELIIDSATKLLDCKQFIKDYGLDKRIQRSTSAIHLSCHVELSDQPKDAPSIPPEMIVLPSNATFAELRNEATKAFQEVYAMFTRFGVDGLPEFGAVDDSMAVKFLVGQSGSVRIKGVCPSKHALNQFRMERGTEKWIVDCICGANDDDGERMLACDSCGVWQHTRCAGIDDADDIPNKFVCKRSVIKYNGEGNLRMQDMTSRVSVSSGACKGDAQGSRSIKVGTRFSMASTVH